jgi:hypothetical protein
MGVFVVLFSGYFNGSDAVAPGALAAAFDFAGGDGGH